MTDHSGHDDEAAVAAAWHEFRYPRPAIDEPTDAFRRAIKAALETQAAEITRLRRDLENAHVAIRAFVDPVTGPHAEITRLKAENEQLEKRYGGRGYSGSDDPTGDRWADDVAAADRQEPSQDTSYVDTDPWSEPLPSTWVEELPLDRGEGGK